MRSSSHSSNDGIGSFLSPAEHSTVMLLMRLILMLMVMLMVMLSYACLRYRGSQCARSELSMALLRAAAAWGRAGRVFVFCMRSYVSLNRRVVF